MKKFISLISLIFICFTSGCTDVNDFFDSTNYELLEQDVVSNSISSNITITRRCTHTVSSTLAKKVTEASAVIFKETTSYYYFITNNHVTTLINGYYKNYLSVTDYLDNDYLNDVTILHSSANFNLAIGRFPKGKTKLNVVSMADSNATKNDITIALGVDNNITFGKAELYSKVDIEGIADYMSNITFSILKHSAETISTSSGGAVLNVQLQLIAVSFTDILDDEGEFSCSYAIPIQMVKSFISSYQFCDCCPDDNVEEEKENVELNV